MIQVDPYIRLHRMSNVKEMKTHVMRSGWAKVGQRGWSWCDCSSAFCNGKLACGVWDLSISIDKAEIDKRCFELEKFDCLVDFWFMRRPSCRIGRWSGASMLSWCLARCDPRLRCMRDRTRHMIDYIAPRYHPIKFLSLTHILCIMYVWVFY